MGGTKVKIRSAIGGGHEFIGQTLYVISTSRDDLATRVMSRPASMLEPQKRYQRYSGISGFNLETCGNDKRIDGQKSGMCDQLHKQ